MNNAALTAADILQKLMASFAFLVGGFWVLMNYIRNRTHVPRLQVEVNAELITRGNRHYLLATCQAKNVGLSIIRLPAPEPGGEGPRGSALVVRTLPDFQTEDYIIEVPWDAETTAFDVFANHRSIEPGLTISEQKLIYHPDLGYDAAWVQLRVSAHDQKWTAVSVAVLEKDVETSTPTAQGG
jgi:hypothetical protein